RRGDTARLSRGSPRRRVAVVPILVRVMTLALVGRLDKLAPGDIDRIVRRGASAGAPWPDVSAIEDAVRTRGDAALRELTLELDKVELRSFEVPRAEWSAAHARLPQDVRDALAAAKAN